MIKAIFTVYIFLWISKKRKLCENTYIAKISIFTVDAQFDSLRVSAFTCKPVFSNPLLLFCTSSPQVAVTDHGVAGRGRPRGHLGIATENQQPAGVSPQYDGNQRDGARGYCHQYARTQHRYTHRLSHQYQRCHFSYFFRICYSFLVISI